MRRGARLWLKGGTEVEPGYERRGRVFESASEGVGGSLFTSLGMLPHLSSYRCLFLEWEVEAETVVKIVLSS